MKKGFTLVELLAVIVILGLLGLIIIPSVTGNLKKQKENLYKIQIKNIEEATKGWASENFFKLPAKDNEYTIIHLKDLEGFIDTEIVNPTNSSETFGQCLEIVITKVSGADNYTYKVNENTIYNNYC